MGTCFRSRRGARSPRRSPNGSTAVSGLFAGAGSSGTGAASRTLPRGSAGGRRKGSCRRAGRVRRLSAARGSASASTCGRRFLCRRLDFPESACCARTWNRSSTRQSSTPTASTTTGAPTPTCAAWIAVGVWSGPVGSCATLLVVPAFTFPRGRGQRRLRVITSECHHPSARHRAPRQFQPAIGMREPPREVDGRRIFRNRWGAPMQVGRRTRSGFAPVTTSPGSPQAWQGSSCFWHPPSRRLCTSRSEPERRWGERSTRADADCWHRRHLRLGRGRSAPH